MHNYRRQRWQDISLLILLLVVFCGTPHGYAQISKTRKVVFIIVDGIPADLIEKISPPTLQEIAKQGGYARAYVGGVKGTYSETPTISAVGYNSVLTGTWVNKHNVWDNDIAKPNYAYHTIFRYFKQQYPAKKTAIFSTWLDNRTKLVGDKLAATGNIALDYHYDGMELDTVHFPHDSKGQYLDIIDDSVASHAARYIENYAPDLSWVYLEHTDDVSHQHGDSPEFTSAIGDADKRIGRIWNAIQHRQKNNNEEWLIIVTTDHGRDAATGRNHGGQSDRERSGWIFTNARGLNEQFRAPHLSIVDIMPTIARFLNISVPRDQAYEVDGIPFTGKLSFMQPMVNSDEGIRISWKPVAASKKEKVKIWIADSNQFQAGEKDTYRLVKTVPIRAGETRITEEASKTGFRKIVIEGVNNTANAWIVEKKLMK